MRTAFRTVGAVAPALAARWAETIFCTPPPRREVDEAFIATGSRFSVASQGQRLAGWRWGSGPTVVLVHGWGSRASRLSDLAVALVEAGFEALVRDLPAGALVIHDRDDPGVPFAHGQEIVGAWAGTRLESTSGLGHRALLRDPAVIGWAVTFLREGSGG